MSFDASRDLAAILAQAPRGLQGMEQEAFALRYATLVVDRDGTGPAERAAARLAHAVAALRGPGSPPMALFAVGSFEGTVGGQAALPDGRAVVVALALPG